MIPLALSSGSLYSYGLPRVWELAAETGFDAVEILVDERWDTRQAAYLRRLAGLAGGLPIAAIHSPFMPHLPGWPADAVGRLQHSAALAREVGAGVVVAHLPLRIRGVRVEFFGVRAGRALVPLPLPMPDEKSYRRFLLSDLPALEAETGVVVALENMPVKRLLGRPVDIYSLNRLEVWAGLPHLTMDTTHLGTWGYDPLTVYERMKDRLAHVHLSNFDGREHRLPPDGRLALDQLLRRLATDGYGGAVSVEVGPEVVEAEDEDRVRAHLRRAVAFCREHLGQ